MFHDSKKKIVLFHVFQIVSPKAYFHNVEPNMI